ncbi:MAG TPA: hypothetical protein DDY78_22675 [Planctomycetales bacterium]|jgi:hypothetical protein|nr:hypothetical protein [Planctomycetales bacterium]
MSGLRLITEAGNTPMEPCVRCLAGGCPWDHVAGNPMCPDCQEALALGESEPLRQRVESKSCAICQRAGTLPYLTYPLHAAAPVEIDLCGGHFEALLGRRLGRNSFRVLERQLQLLGVNVKQIFLLHEAFYDRQGRSLQPIPQT